MAPNSSVTRSTTRVVSAPSAIKFVIVRQQRELAVDAAARERLGDDLLAADVAVDAQVAPADTQLLQIDLAEVENERRILQMLELRRDRDRAPPARTQGLLSMLSARAKIFR